MALEDRKGCFLEIELQRLVAAVDGRCYLLVVVPVIALLCLPSPSDCIIAFMFAFLTLSSIFRFSMCATVALSLSVPVLISTLCSVFQTASVLAILCLIGVLTELSVWLALSWD